MAVNNFKNYRRVTFIFEAWRRLFYCDENDLNPIIIRRLYSVTRSRFRVNPTKHNTAVGFITVADLTTAISARALAPPEEFSENYHFCPSCETRLKRCTLRAMRGRVAITITFPLVCIHKKNVLVDFYYIYIIIPLVFILRQSIAGPIKIHPIFKYTLLSTLLPYASTRHIVWSKSNKRSPYMYIYLYISKMQTSF